MERAILRPRGHTDEGGVLLGDPRSHHWLVVYEDPQCPYCRRFEERCGDLLRQKVREDELSVEYRMRSLLGPESVRADNALALAAEVGAFDALRTELFSAQPKKGTGGYAADDLVAMGRRVGITGPDYADGVREGRYEEWVEVVDRIFQDQDPDGTPGAYLDGRPVAREVLDDDQALRALLGSSR